MGEATKVMGEGTGLMGFGSCEGTKRRWERLSRPRQDPTCSLTARVRPEAHG